MPTAENPGNDAGATKPKLGGESTARQVVDAEAVRAQVERILKSAPFRNSKRYPALLCYLVEQELNGASSTLKERTIAIEVFGRDRTTIPVWTPWYAFPQERFVSGLPSTIRRRRTRLR